MTFKEYFESIKDSVMAIHSFRNGQEWDFHTKFRLSGDKYYLGPAQPVYIYPNEEITFLKDSIVVKDIFNRDTQLFFLDRKLVSHPIFIRMRNQINLIKKFVRTIKLRKPKKKLTGK